MPAKPTTIDEFLARLSADKRAALEQLRRDIHAAAPGLEEVISYGVPGFKLDGRLLVWFGAGANHCSFYPGALPIAVRSQALAGYATSKGTIRFAPSAPLPSTLVAALVTARVTENAARAARTESKKTAAKRSTRKAAEGAKATPKRGSASAAKGGPKSAATRGAKRSPAKRGSAKRTSAKRPAARRAPTKRTSAKRPAPRRAPTKRTKR